MVVISQLKRAAGLGSPQHHDANHHPFLKQALHAFQFQFHNQKHLSQVLVKSFLGLFFLRWSYLLLLASQEDTTPFLPSPYNYSLPAIPTKYTLPPPHLTEQPNVLIVLSARGNFQRRAVIRDTYAHGHDNIYFVIGGPEPNDTDDKNLTHPSSVSSQLLFKEQSTYQDIIDSIHPDSYRGLPFKVHFALQYIAQKLPHINWVVKVDDDAVVRWQRLQFFLLSTLNAATPMVVGNVALNWQPHPTGKWAEDPKFVALNKPYPPFCPGSAGYALSRPVVQYLASQPQYYYANEDVGVGIWLDDSPLQVKWIWTQDMTSKGECEDRYHIIGHKLDATQIKICFETLGDQVPTTEKQIVSSFGHGKHEWKP